MTDADARTCFEQARVARLATAGRDGRPHLVPFTYALLGEATLVTAVDHKPKRTTALRRLANIAANPAVSALVDHYAEDWSALWWARADGRARVIEPDAEPATRARAIEALQRRYEQYRTQVPSGAVIMIDVQRWSGWSARAPTS